MVVISASNYQFFNFRILQNIQKKKEKQHLFNSSSSSPIKSESSELEIRVCVNRTCRKQGSRETLDILSSLAPPHVSVTSCGCLGKCGSGPNLVFLPQAVFVSHCATPARIAQVLATYLGKDDTDDPSRNLAALALRKRAEEELEKGNLSEAEVLLSQAIDLKPSGGLHIIYTTRSSTRLAIGKNMGALEDAKEALALAPYHPQAYLCQGNAFLALEEFVAAENSYSIALQNDPSIRRSKSFKAWVTKLQDKLTAADISS
ncbi:tetratricopeptide repeat (TPR)-containing protein [Thalictrum thalictroides]|uniref:Tetratricopeptide repeat (TPR)-containing protein n=1 Tax=Thalictrum thalictroides TaxID=46969 RepID=A0A7J6X3P1_THATH|nr:tetratricopeptide repeat (TPR)-containing protein [Thalictrum thalictroides]